MDFVTGAVAVLRHQHICGGNRVCRHCSPQKDYSVPAASPGGLRSPHEDKVKSGDLKVRSAGVWLSTVLEVRCAPEDARRAPAQSVGAFVYPHASVMEASARKIEEKQQKYCDRHNIKRNKSPYQLKEGEYVRVKLGTMVRKGESKFSKAKKVLRVFGNTVISEGNEKWNVRSLVPCGKRLRLGDEKDYDCLEQDDDDDLDLKRMSRKTERQKIQPKLLKYYV
ncbi:hypothetical protein NDU88_001729 [Pleurodeles waltl]|uniref:Uncharacterized protein n=1 Tax=Pleurodeles waltl TaxID=8319 RepID=A0AAV7R9W8_PLEWA|nr:hypothetical protein NDU88_001729 [Pleurodeles waltl]